MLNEKLVFVEEFMFILSGWAEIYNTKYFSTIFEEENYDQEDFDDLILFLTYLYNDKEIRGIYPKTVYYIPEIIDALLKIQDNQLALNNIFKGGEDKDNDET